MTLIYGLSNVSNCNDLECPWRSFTYCKPCKYDISYLWSMRPLRVAYAWTLCAKMTSSSKPEVYNISQRHQRRSFSYNHGQHASKIRWSVDCPKHCNRCRGLRYRIDNVTQLKAEKTRSSADAEGPRDAPQIRNIALAKACNRWMTFKDTQGHCNCCYLSITSCKWLVVTIFLSSIVSSILPLFQCMWLPVTFCLLVNFY